MLPEEVGRPPQVPDGVIGEAERTEAGVDGVALGAGCVACPAQELGGAFGAVGDALENARQRRRRPALTSGEDIAAGGLAALVDRRQHDGRIEHAKGGDDHLAGDVAHARRAAAEIPG